MKRKIALVCMAALTGTMLITACGSNETGKNVTASDGKAKVRFATWDVADDLDAQQKLVDKFNEEHDDIEVTLEAYGSDYDTKISAGMGSGDTCICGIIQHMQMDLSRLTNILKVKVMILRKTSTALYGITIH